MIQRKRTTDFERTPPVFRHWRANGDGSYMVGEQGNARKMMPFLSILCVCGGWGGDGHKIVGRIASKELSPQATAAVTGMLASGETLAEASTWADEVKRTRQWGFTRPMHYADVPDGADGFNLERDCPEEGCVVAAITHYGAVLKDPAASTTDRATALRFLVHFVGDIHQPLHVGHRGDKGGNDIDVEFFGQRKNLHSVWDSSIIDHIGEPWQVMGDRLHNGITVAQRSTWRADLDPVTWANESFEKAVTNAYEIGDGDLGSGYFNRNRPVVEERLSAAGIRLAALINQAFEQTPVADPSHAQYVSSKKSNVYHLADCQIVPQIAEWNRLEHDAPPSGKRLHRGCPLH